MHHKRLVFYILSALCYALPILSSDDKELDEQPTLFDWEFFEEDEMSSDIEGLDLIQKDRVPKHIGFIMDGNRRWAKQQGLPENQGHAEGADTVIRLIKLFCNNDLGIETMTLYAFSTENWKRDKTEVNLLMNLFTAYINEIIPYLRRYSIRLETIGDLEKLPLALQQSLQKVKAIPIDNPKFTLVLALNYGGRDELKRAFSKMLLDFEQGVFTQTDISEELIHNYLDTHAISDPELIIRTSGELRISNFLLWQLAYSEFHFSASLWPDFSEQELINILLEFQKRERRFGGGKK